MTIQYYFSFYSIWEYNLLITIFVKHFNLTIFEFINLKSISKGSLNSLILEIIINYFFIWVDLYYITINNNIYLFYIKIVKENRVVTVWIYFFSYTRCKYYFLFIIFVHSNNFVLGIGIFFDKFFVYWVVVIFIR